MYKKIIGLAVLPFLLAGCADNINSDHYNTNQAGKVSTVSQCTVLSVRQVGVNSDSGAGTLIGGIAGGIAGSQIGGGNTAHLLGAVGGAILGGFAGNAAQEGLTSQQGYEYIVRLDNGNTVSTTQGADVLLNPGQRCQIIFGNPARIIPN